MLDPFGDCKTLTIAFTLLYLLTYSTRNDNDRSELWNLPHSNILYKLRHEKPRSWSVWIKMSSSVCPQLLYTGLHCHGKTITHFEYLIALAR